MKTTKLKRVHETKKQKIKDKLLKSRRKNSLFTETSLKKTGKIGRSRRAKVEKAIKGKDERKKPSQAKMALRGILKKGKLGEVLEEQLRMATTGPKGGGGFAKAWAQKKPIRAKIRGREKKNRSTVSKMSGCQMFRHTKRKRKGGVRSRKRFLFSGKGNPELTRGGKRFPLTRIPGAEIMVC